MHIAILTFQRAYNYGTAFQAYALQYVLQNILNCNVEIVDYECPFINDLYKPLRLDRRNANVIKAILKSILQYPIKKRRYNNFNNFLNKHFNLTEKVDKKSIKKLNDNFDMFIVGSDQIWNDEITGFDETYYLDFVNEDSKKYAYSASFGYSEISEAQINKLSEFLNKFANISAREKSAASIISKCTGKFPPITLDPTLLVDRQVWKQLAVNPVGDEKYILVYTIQPPVKLLDFALDLKRKTGLKIIYLNDQIKKIKGMHYKSGVSPEEFLGYFNNAEYILSNSFHGTVFPIIFKKKFFVELEAKTQINIRSQNLLNFLELSSRSELVIDNIDQPIDWVNVNNKIEKLKDYSFEYLKKITQKIE